MEIRRVPIEHLLKFLLIKELVSKILKMLRRKEKRNKEKLRSISKDKVESIVDYMKNFSPQEKI